MKNSPQLVSFVFVVYVSSEKIFYVTLMEPTVELTLYLDVEILCQYVTPVRTAFACKLSVVALAETSFV